MRKKNRLKRTFEGSDILLVNLELIGRYLGKSVIAGQEQGALTLCKRENKNAFVQQDATRTAKLEKPNNTTANEKGIGGLQVHSLGFGGTRNSIRALAIKENSIS